MRPLSNTCQVALNYTNLYSLNKTSEIEDGLSAILGFDYKGLGEDNRVNNIYADTNNYKKSNEAATYYGNWESQTYSVIFNNPDKRYIRVLGENNFIPKRFSKLNNLTHMSVADFQAKMAS